MLHDALNEHPEIGKPPRGLHYFSDGFHKGEGWYAQQLSRHVGRRVTLEFSVSYTYPEHHEAAAERISSLVPDAKLFAIVRNPVDRAFSDYLRSIRLCEIEPTTTFEEALERYPVLLERGSYHRLLAPYLSRFPTNRVLILFLEELVAEPDRFWNSLWDFIGVDRNVRPADADYRIGRRSVRWPILNRTLFAAKSACDAVAGRLGLTPAWNRAKRHGKLSYRRLISWNTVSVKMKPETRTRLQQYYRDDVRALERLCGRALSHWIEGDVH
jgi:hypothetical protein